MLQHTQRASPVQEHPELGAVQAHWGMCAAAKAVLQASASAGSAAALLCALLNCRTSMTTSSCQFC